MAEKINRAERIAAGASVPSRLSRLSFPNSSTLLIFLVVAVEIGVGLFLIRDLRTANVETERMYQVSVLGLRRIGEMQYQAQETRRSSLYALTTSDSNLQVEYADHSRAADQRVTEGVSEYVKHAQTSREIELGTRLASDWAAYLKVRDDVLASILEGSAKEAVALDLSGGVPSFERVRADLDEIKRLYDDQASQRLANVAAGSRRSILKLIGVLTFTLLFASGAIWAIQHSRVQSALQLANLQMEFVASVSHELRTPLAVICSAADNIADGVVGSKEQVSRYGSVIRRQSRQITELVNQILLFASTKERHQRLVVHPLQVEKLVAAVVESSGQMLRDANFQAEQQVPPNLPEVAADDNALSQCLQNLVANAVKYGGAARWLCVRAVAGEGSGHVPEVRISVEDKGIGIDASEISRIFEPFYRSPAVTEAQIHGTGLGLSVAKSLVEAMGGKLTVKSKRGAGSTFTLHLPVAKEGPLEVAEVSPGKSNPTT